METTHITGEVTINAPRQKVWDALADFGNVSRMSANIKKSYLTSDTQCAVGATRHCDLAMLGAALEERIVNMREGEYMKIDIYKRKHMPLIANMHVEFFLREENGNIVLKAAMHYAMTGFIGDILNKAILMPQNKKEWRKFLAGIKHYIETGKPIDAHTLLDTASVAMS